MPDLTGRVALVTGASSGIGAHLAVVLARAGATVALGARRAARLQETAAAIGAAGGRAIPVELDVTSSASVEEAFAAVERAAGVPDILLNNAGMAVAKPSLELTEDEWTRTLQTNLTGQWLCAVACARRLIAAKRGGAIVNVVSIVGERPAPGLSAYGASKAALLHLTKSLALEWARYGIRVNAISPGYIETEINAEFFRTPAGEQTIRAVPQRRLGQLSDLDAPLLLLVSDGAAFMTGAEIAVDGGHRLGLR